MRLAARGQRDLDGTTEAIGDRTERAQLRRQARKVYLQGLVTAALITALIALLPRP